MVMPLNYPVSRVVRTTTEAGDAVKDISDLTGLKQAVVLRRLIDKALAHPEIVSQIIEEEANAK